MLGTSGCMDVDAVLVAVDGWGPRHDKQESPVIVAQADGSDAPVAEAFRDPRAITMLAWPIIA